MQKIKTNTQDVLKCLRLGFSSSRVDTWCQYYKALSISYIKVNNNQLNDIEFRYANSISNKIKDKILMMKRGMKVCLYELTPFDKIFCNTFIHFSKNKFLRKKFFFNEKIFFHEK